MRCVNETLPRPLRWRYPLMTLRLTSSSFAGTLRKLVAVGTPRLRSMLATMTAPTPRMGDPVSGDVAGLAAGEVAGVAAAGVAGAAAGTGADGAGGAGGA